MPRPTLDAPMYRPITTCRRGKRRGDRRARPRRRARRCARAASSCRSSRRARVGEHEARSPTSNTCRPHHLPSAERCALTAPATPSAGRRCRGSCRRTARACAAASTSPWPSGASARARCSALVRTACNACHSRRGVAGMSKCRMPAERSASMTAFISAGIEPVTPRLAHAFRAERIELASAPRAR